MRGDQLARRRAVVLQRGDVAVAAGVVIGGIDDDLAGERRGRQPVVEEEGHREHDDLAGRRGGRDVVGRVRMRARAPPTSSASESAPRELASVTSWPVSVRRRASVAPILPLPMIATVHHALLT